MSTEDIKHIAIIELLEALPTSTKWSEMKYFTDKKGNVHPITGKNMPDTVKEELRNKKLKTAGKALALGLVGAAGVKLMFKRGGGLKGLIRHEKKYTPGFAKATEKVTKAVGTISAAGKKIRKVIPKKSPIEKAFKRQAKSEAFLRMPANKALSREGWKALKQGKLTKGGTLKKLKTEKPKAAAREAIKKRQELIRKLNPSLKVVNRGI